MRLLITTQALDTQDSNLGFFHHWVEEFAAHCEKVIVICLREGTHVLPDNVIVLSLGKHDSQPSGIIQRVMYAVRFRRYISNYKDEYDAVLVHMNPEYVLLGGALWHRWHKKVGLWYAHKSVTKKLERAVTLVDRVFTVSDSSFKVETPKLCALGHGIDTELFAPDIHLESTQTRIVTAGRIAESKHLIEMLQTLDELHARGENFTFTIVGDATTPDEAAYKKKLQEEIAQRPYRANIVLRGVIPHHELPALLRTQDICFNFGATGNMDKAGLEALAVGLPLVSTNEAFEALLSPYGLYVPTLAPVQVADALQEFLRRPDRPGVVATLRNKVAEEHSLSNLIPKILAQLQ